MIKHFVQIFLKGSNPALTYPFFFFLTKPPTSKRLHKLAAKTDISCWVVHYWSGQEPEQKQPGVIFFVFKCSEVLL